MAWSQSAQVDGVTTMTRTTAPRGASRDHGHPSPPLRITGAVNPSRPDLLIVHRNGRKPPAEKIDPHACSISVWRQQALKVHRVCFIMVAKPCRGCIGPDKCQRRGHSDAI